ncbi:hypothetical protein JTE90_010228 [Oedothorax gibbosus]|uniref:Uncharacterized protein n=1 Tax=Oedothorax gibbosus TaxID=931172 RepID=A0AAV6UKG6_9ARAC|nr:hypothetical protein JTE90_010228 [Oedothorax gibbosus]
MLQSWEEEATRYIASRPQQGAKFKTQMQEESKREKKRYMLQSWEEEEGRPQDISLLGPNKGPSSRHRCKKKASEKRSDICCSRGRKRKGGHKIYRFSAPTRGQVQDTDARRK